MEMSHEAETFCDNNCSWTDHHPYCFLCNGTPGGQESGEVESAEPYPSTVLDRRMQLELRADVDTWLRNGWVITSVDPLILGRNDNDWEQAVERAKNRAEVE